MGPEQTRLMDRLFGDHKDKNFKLYCGTQLVTSEQLCGQINKAMDEMAPADDVTAVDPHKLAKILWRIT